jgi:hypothetical protein
VTVRLQHTQNGADRSSVIEPRLASSILRQPEAVAFHKSLSE